MKKNLAVLGITLTLATIPCSPIYAKKIYPAEIMGRDLLIPGLGWAGHVGIATTYMMSPAGMGNNADQVIEVLNENPVGQVNSISNFKSRSKYWGSKYGVADRGVVGYNILVEANHQRWWCPKYTNDTNYHIGSGIPTTGQVIECGTWRCDTYAWWAFYSQGLDTMPGRVWLPRNLFNFFPYYNDERFALESSEQPSEILAHKSLENVTAEELNEMPYEEFQMIMDTPPVHYVTSPSTVQMQFAYNSNLNDVKRGIMIDRLIADDTETDLVKKLLNLYNETDNIEVKNKIVQGLMLYNQRHRNVKYYIKNDQPLLKGFFTELLDSKSLNPKMADDAIRGFIDTHSSEEIMISRDKIDKWLPTTGHYSSIMLKYTLVHKSKDLQPIYIKSIVDELRKANNSDLDSYLFGPLSIGYQGTGKNLLEPESKQIVADYLKEVRYKYTPQGIKANPKDTHRNTTAPYYFELIKHMGM
ncbi:hypothetical protein [Legionella yabuuchiae]|uniref:hypothetical protein n=1 Tax=Legionella yabuuchiae TaxID=376727 RepID=UPI001F5E78C6|nr:hypothetical protein [Legionella yabuuchiae]